MKRCTHTQATLLHAHRHTFGNVEHCGASVSKQCTMVFICFVDNALPVKYQITAHRPCMHGIQLKKISKSEHSQACYAYSLLEAGAWGSLCISREAEPLPCSVFSLSTQLLVLVHIDIWQVLTFQLPNVAANTTAVPCTIGAHTLTVLHGSLPYMSSFKLTLKLRSCLRQLCFSALALLLPSFMKISVMATLNYNYYLVYVVSYTIYIYIYIYIYI